MRPTTPRYERDHIVRIISDFYSFLARFYIEESALKYPSPGGWPNINLDNMAQSRKSSWVIDLLQHLPYIDENKAREEINNIHSKCDVIDYSAWTAHRFVGNWCNHSEIGVRSWIEDSAHGNVERDEDDSDISSEEWYNLHEDEDPEEDDIPNLIGIAQG